jgi:hypothetical protein
MKNLIEKKAQKLKYIKPKVVVIKQPMVAGP